MRCSHVSKHTLFGTEPHRAHLARKLLVAGVRDHVTTESIRTVHHLRTHRTLVTHTARILDAYSECTEFRY